MTQLESAKKDKLTPLMKAVARSENIGANFILLGIKEGNIVIPANNKRKLKSPCGIGHGLRTKINANLGTSTDKCRIEKEIKKLKVALRYGADAVMDLSVGGNLPLIRKQVVRHSPVPVGTVPVYEIAVQAQNKKGDFLDFDIEDILEVLNAQAEDGVDFFTIHAGVTKSALDILKNNKRILNIVSRGGAIMAGWIKRNKKENPFFEHFDRVLEIAHRRDVTLSLGDGLRPGSIFDATDKAQIAELENLGKLARRARSKGVQVMIEGPGHVPINQIAENVRLEKRICNQAPFYVLGPLVTDAAAGYDHITGAIGGAIAASEGADFLCYVTPSEHLRHPSIEDVKEGVIASKIAAHAADIVKAIPSALKQDKIISQARKKRDWKKQLKFCIDPEKATRYRASSKPNLKDVCTMCGKYCPIKLTEEYL